MKWEIYGNLSRLEASCISNLKTWWKLRSAPVWWGTLLKSIRTQGIAALYRKDGLRYRSSRHGIWCKGSAIFLATSSIAKFGFKSAIVFLWTGSCCPSPNGGLAWTLMNKFGKAGRFPPQRNCGQSILLQSLNRVSWLLTKDRPDKVARLFLLSVHRWKSMDQRTGKRSTALC